MLRPPGVFEVRPPLEDGLYQALGARMTSHNGYLNQRGYELYDTTGTTEDWSFWNTGGLGFTFEIGPDEFHPPYETGVVAEYLGLAAGGRRRQRRQPGRVLRDVLLDGRHGAALHHPGDRAAPGRSCGCTSSSRRRPRR